MIKDKANLKKVLLAVLIIAVVGCLVYGNSLKGGFIGDDLNLVRDSKLIRSWANLPIAFKRSLLVSMGGARSFYRPLPRVTYMLDYSIWGLNVIGYHLTNTLLHIFAALALFWLVNTLFKDKLLSLLASLLFVVHPVQVEAVAYITSRNDSLVVLFLLLSFVFYIKYTELTKPGVYILMVISYFLAVISKANSLVLPGLLLTYHFAFRKKIKFEAIGGIIFIAVTYTASKSTFFRTGISDSTMFQRVPGVFSAITSYLRMLILPFGLHMDYGQKLFSFSDPTVILGILISAALITCAFVVRKRNRLIFFGVFWFFIAFFPVANLFRIFAYMADHFLYLPAIGLFLIASSFFCTAYRNEKYRTTAVVFTAALLVFYSGLTIRQNEYWQDPVSFYRKTLEYNPDSVFASMTLGAVYYELGKKDKAWEMFKKTVKLKPDYAQAYYDMGIISEDRGNPEEAIKYYQTALKYDPDLTSAYNRMSAIYRKVGDMAQAIRLCEKAARDNPDDTVAFYNLGFHYHVAGLLQDAINAYKKAVELSPDNAQAINNIAAIYHASGNRTEALVFYTRAIQADPEYHSVYGNRALLYYEIKEYNKAWADVNRCRALGGSINPEIIEKLKKVSEERG